MVLRAAEVTEPFSISILLHKLKCKCPFLSLAAIKSVDYIIFWEVRVAAPKNSLSFTLLRLQFASKRVSNLCSLCVSVSKYPFKRRQSRMDNGLLRLWIERKISFLMCALISILHISTHQPLHQCVHRMLLQTKIYFKVKYEKRNICIH